MAKQMDMIHGPLLPKILMVALPLAVTSILIVYNKVRNLG